MSGRVIGTILLGVAGAFFLPIIGAGLGITAAMGFSIGAAIGGMLFAPGAPDQEGPRIGDTQVTSSALGKPIPRHYGVTRTGGNIFWAAGLKEIKKEEEVGGKGGGGGGTVTTYDYYANFAIAFGAAKGRQVRRIWGDGKLIYDGFAGIGKPINFRFVPGGHGTPVDPLISESINRRLADLPDVNQGNQEQLEYKHFGEMINELQQDFSPRGQIYMHKMQARLDEVGPIGAAAEGVPDFRMTPSYSEFCYIVFDDMELADFGNRIPQITAEIEWDIDDGDMSPEEPNKIDISEIFPGQPTGGIAAVDASDKTLITDAGDGKHLRRFTLYGNKEDRYTETLGAEEDAVITNVLATNNKGQALAIGTKDGDAQLFWISTSTMAILSSSDWDGVNSTNGLFSNLFSLYEGSGLFDGIFGSAWTGGSHTYAVRFPLKDGGDATHFLIATDDRLKLVGEGHVMSSHAPEGLSKVGPFGHPYSQDGGNAKVISTRYDDTRIRLNKCRPGDFFTMILEGGGRGETTRRVESSNIIQHHHETVDLGAQLAGDAIESIPFFQYDSRFLHKDYVKERDHMNWRCLIRSKNGGGYVRTQDNGLHAVPRPPHPMSGYTSSTSYNGIMLYGSGRSLIRVNMYSGEYHEYEEFFATDVTEAPQVYLAEINSLIIWDDGKPQMVFIGSQTVGANGSRSLSAIIADVCRRAGMEPDEFDLSGVGDHIVRGFSQARPATARKILEVLLPPYHVDGIERDWQVVFNDRVQEPVRTIKERELGQVGDQSNSSFFAETRTPEYDIPRQVNINYLDPDRDFATGTATKSRIADPVSTMDSPSVENVEFPIVMQEDQAKDLAETMLFRRWMSRDRGRAKLNWAHLDLDPADIVTFEFEDGRTLTERLEKITTGANFEAEVDTTRFGDPVFTPSNGARVVSSVVPVQKIRVPVPSRMFVFDIPLLEDFHGEENATVKYMAVGAIAEGWRSATIYKSYGIGGYGGINSTGNEITWGDVIGTLGAPRALWSTDRENTIRIWPSVDLGNINSVTREDILNNANRALIWNPSIAEGEIIQFQTATANADGSYTLSDLQRGLRGTDYFVDKHLPGAQFFLLTEPPMMTETHSLDLLNSTAYYKAVSAGQVISAANELESTAKGRDLMPWAPSRVRRSDDGSDLSVTWNRRARLGGRWDVQAAQETTPLIEANERYECYLLPSGSEAHKFFDPLDPTTYVAAKTVYSPNCSFTADEMSGGGVSLDDDINLVVYQMSDRVGHGFPRHVSLAP